MISYSAAAMERTMKIHDVILRAVAKKIRWWEAAEILGIGDRQMRRWKERYEAEGYDGLSAYLYLSHLQKYRLVQVTSSIGY